MPSRIFKSIEKTRRWIQNCLVCGAGYPPIDVLCSYCLKKLRASYIPPRYMLRIQSSFYHVRLIDWDSENKKFIRLLIKDLKGENGSLLFELLAEEFLFRLGHLDYFKEPHVIIPCPPTPDEFSLWNLLFKKDFQQKKDHSFYWAKSLSQRTNYPVQNVLSHPPYYSLQKSKGLIDRMDRKFVTDDSFKQNQRYIFTDDIVTSGATAKAAYLALQKPAHFAIWSIFWKKKNYLEIS